MKKILQIIIVFMLFGNLAARDLSGNSMFSDHKSRQIGDILTVTILESAQASNEAKTSTANSNKLSISGAGTGALDFVPTMGLSGANGNTYSGSGKTERKGSFRTNVSVRIKDILNNGNYIIEGDKVVNINGEKQITSLSGIVRAEDIADNNIVYSNKIASLQIVYTGEGKIKDAEEPGIITQFFNWLF